MIVIRKSICTALASVAVLCMLVSHTALAALNIEITRGVVRPIPIAIAPFSEGKDLPVDFAAIVSQDLANSGQFDVLNRRDISQFPSNLNQVDMNYWRSKNVDNIVVGNVKKLGDRRYQVEFSLIDLFKGDTRNTKPTVNTQVLVTRVFESDETNARRLAHHISDIVYNKLTGVKGVFSTRIAYVVVKRPAHYKKEYLLEVADMDGENATAILRSKQPIMSPSWAPDGRQLAYVSFETKLPKIFISDVVTGKRAVLTNFAGINGAPAWSPDGKRIAVALSMEHTNPNIYVVDIATQRLQQITHDWSINTEPSWAPNGKSIVFTSDRGGSPQIYTYDFYTNKTSRLTYRGSYNASASFLPEGNELILLHKNDTGFNIARMELHSGSVQELTNSGKNDSPSVAPNGRMVLYATRNKYRGVLEIVSTNGLIKMRLPNKEGDVQEPAWSPYLG